MMRKILLLISIVIFIIAGCKNEKWDDYYNQKPATIDKNVWDAIQENSSLTYFVNAIKNYHLDTLFDKENSVYTLFVPDNEAFEKYQEEVNPRVLKYLISKFVINSKTIKEIRQIQTIGEKYVYLKWQNNKLYFDDIETKFESPIYKNGKYYIISEIPKVLYNLYEYISEYIPVLKNYIDSQDSIVIDKDKSKPIGFDEFGNTIYDTVATIVNKFELKYFPVSKESRYKKATIVFPIQEQYENALTEMAQYMGGTYSTYNDIPLKWQYEYLIPYLLNVGIFENLLDEDKFTLPPDKDTLKLKNIHGDSVIIDYQVTGKTICSNGYAYKYLTFKIPDTLYKSPVRYEGERLVKDLGGNNFQWMKFVNVISDKSFAVRKIKMPYASNDTVIYVSFGTNYNGKFSIEFNIDNLFARSYRMVIKTHINIGGKYNVYVNDALVRTFDYYYYVSNNYYYRSIVDNKIYKPTGSLNIFDCRVNNITEYGKTKIKIEYTGPSNILELGLVIDYIEFIPIKNN